MKKGWWEISYTIPPNDCDLEHIAGLIKEGYTSGDILQEEEQEDLTYEQEDLIVEDGLEKRREGK